MIISINGVELADTDLMENVFELKALLRDVKGKRDELAADIYESYLKAIQYRIGKVVTDSEGEYRQDFVMQVAAKKVEFIEGIEDEIVFYPGSSLQYVQSRDGTKAVMQCVPLKDIQGWAWGSFKVTFGKAVTLTGKVSKSRIVDHEGVTIFLVCFDLESARVIDLMAMKGSVQSSRHTNNPFYLAVTQAFNSLYPILVDGKIGYKVINDAITFERMVMFPKGVELENQRKGRREERQQQIQERRRQDKEVGFEGDEEMEVGLE